MKVTLAVAVFTCCVFAVLAQAVAAVPAVVAVQLNAVRQVAGEQVNTRTGDSVSAIFCLVFFAYKKLLARTEMRTRDRTDRQSI